jgi:hypothetical protein
MSISQLKKIYAREGIVLVLGAGVSVGSGIPTWTNLLKKMVTKEFNNDEKMFNRLRKRDMSLPAIASLLQERYRSRKKLVEETRDVLYADFPFYRIGTDKENRGKFLRYIHEGIWDDGKGNVTKIEPNTTLRAVGAFCTAWKEPEKGESGYQRNPTVHALVTLNTDTLLENYVHALTIQELLQSVDRPSAVGQSDRIKLYHMHGQLHFDLQEVAGVQKNPDEQQQTWDALDAIVLTEQDYYDFFNEPNSMFNYTFLYLLREYSCLFIGLSMDDENIRRLLHYSKRERIEALKKKLGDTVSQGKLRAMAIRHFAILARSGNEEVDHARQDTLLPLGVTVLWADKRFKELPQLLGEVYNYAHAEDMWSEVYKD